MEAPSSVLAEFSMEMQASPVETAELVNAGEELLSRAKVVAQRIHERCVQVVESDRSPWAHHNRLDDSH